MRGGSPISFPESLRRGDVGRLDRPCQADRAPIDRVCGRAIRCGLAHKLALACCIYVRSIQVVKVSYLNMFKYGKIEGVKQSATGSLSAAGGALF
jgi:hypothetical protein